MGKSLANARSVLPHVIAPALAVASAFIPPAASAADCASLSTLNLPHVQITAAQTVGGSFAEPQRGPRKPTVHTGLPQFCEVQGISTPVPGSKIGFEVWLPAPDAWSKRLHMVGNGAYGSNIYWAQMVARIRANDVAVATDTGHNGGALTFGRDNPEAIMDWGGGRAVHESVVAAKAIVRAFYGAPQAHSYFSGSSTGGHQALMAAQRYPDDFDGIIAGAPGNNRSHLNLQFLWEFLHNHRAGNNDHPIVPNAKLAMIGEAVTKACDGLDGVNDGVINDPRQCHFDLATLKCSGADQDGCLTSDQITAISAIYQGPRDSRTGAQLFPDFPFGSEGIAYGDVEHPGWSDFWADPQKPSEPQRTDFFRYWVFHDPSWDWWKFNWGSDVDAVTKVVGPVIDAVNPDLSKFRAHGGKLIMFIGWNDPVGSAFEAINYYDSVIGRASGTDDAAKLADTQKFVRLYMVPGMSHTSGGPGATNFSNATRDSAPPVSDARHDMGLALYDWVEKGIAPDALIATHYSSGSGPTGTVQFQRLICVYPQIARFKGGDQNSATSFICEKAKPH